MLGAVPLLFLLVPPALKMRYIVVVIWVRSLAMRPSVLLHHVLTCAASWVWPLRAQVPSRHKFNQPHSRFGLSYAILDALSALRSPNHIWSYDRSKSGRARKATFGPEPVRTLVPFCFGPEPSACSILLLEDYSAHVTAPGLLLAFGHTTWRRLHVAVLGNT